MIKHTNNPFNSISLFSQTNPLVYNMPSKTRSARKNANRSKKRAENSGTTSCSPFTTVITYIDLNDNKEELQDGLRKIGQWSSLKIIKPVGKEHYIAFIVWTSLTEYGKIIKGLVEAPWGVKVPKYKEGHWVMKLNRKAEVNKEKKDFAPRLEF